MLAADRYRFSGYNLPTVKLDDGFDYYVVGVHPYFINQPTMWQKPAFQVGFDTVGGHNDPIFSTPKSRAKATARARSVTPKLDI